MKHPKTIGALALLLALCLPAVAAADATAFWGFSPNPSTRSARGFSLGLNLVIVGFEFEYANTSEDPDNLAPGLRTGMINGMIQTPTRTQFYLTAGGGFYRERLGDASETHVGTNIGGGAKVALAGPLRLRIDYRVFNLRGSPIERNPQRIYVGANFAF